MEGRALSLCSPVPAIPTVLLRLWYHRFWGEEGAGLPLGLQQERGLESLAEQGMLVPSCLSVSALSPFSCWGLQGGF